MADCSFGLEIPVLAPPGLFRSGTDHIPSLHRLRQDSFSFPVQTVMAAYWMRETAGGKGGDVADDTNDSGRPDPEPEAVRSDKKKSRWIALLLLLIPVLGIVLPPPYRGIAPFLFLIPLVISLWNRWCNADVKSGNSQPNSQPNQTHPMPDQDPSAEPYSYTPKDPKDPRRYKPIG
jgi:hypothetical protein